MHASDTKAYTTSCSWLLWSGPPSHARLYCSRVPSYGCHSELRGLQAAMLSFREAEEKGTTCCLVGSCGPQSGWKAGKDCEHAPESLGVLKVSSSLELSGMSRVRFGVVFCLQGR